MTVIKALKAQYKLSIREARELRHWKEKVTKEMRRDFDSDKSKHIVPIKFNGGHKIWSIKGEEK